MEQQLEGELMRNLPVSIPSFPCWIPCWTGRAVLREVTLCPSVFSECRSSLGIYLLQIS